MSGEGDHCARDTSSAVTKEGEKTTMSDRRMTQCENRLRADMMNRLLSDPAVRRCFPGIGDSVTEGLPLCEVLIQRNCHKSDRKSGCCDELEEQVNVDEVTLDGIRNAILSHAEDNLDVLELLLNMPYLPRRSFPLSEGDGPVGCVNVGPTMNTAGTMAIHDLAQRAYLRLLEDAMFDACEREGEDELLDELSIS